MWGAREESATSPDVLGIGIVMEIVVTDKDREMARRCEECPVCVRARKNQKGIAFVFVKSIEGGICPYCKAYEKVHGRKAHESLPQE
jgi:hypothetical protein